MTLALLLLGLALVTGSPADGTWKRGDPERGGGQLLTARKGAAVRFQLELWRGKPSYNSGFVEGTFTPAGSKGAFRSQDRGVPCGLEFEFSRTDVVVRQDPAADCGFGFGVFADGRYRRTSAKTPRFSLGDPRVKD